MEIVIIEMKKYEKYKEKSNNKRLNSWIEFIESPEVVDMSNKEIQEAKKVLEEISEDEHEQYLAELRQKYIMDQKAIEDAGYDKGLKAGIEQGQKQNNLQIAKKMLNKKIDLTTISEITGLSIKELKNL